MSNRICKLIMVTGDNNNKFYDMELKNDIIYVKYGRVGVTSNNVTYPSSKWDKIYNEKTKKGYTDITGFKTESKKQFLIKDIVNKNVKDLIDNLINSSKNNVSSNYLVSAKDVTQKQIDKAQEIVDKLVTFTKKKTNITIINNLLLELYRVIPRKMAKVQYYLLETYDNERLKKMIKEEQELLDNMATQVSQDAKTQDNKDEDKNILDLVGIKIEEATKSDIELCKKYLGHNVKQFSKCFKVINNINENNFNNYVNSVKNKKKELFWHGSRTENWWSILTTGLRIRPSNAVHTGSMFGDGIYFADKAQKSIGYTSLRGSYWSRGSENKAYLTLYEVHVGKQKEVLHHTSECYNFNKDNINADSVFAKGGADLRNNEYIIYRSEQCKPIFIVEIKD